MRRRPGWPRLILALAMIATLGPVSFASEATTSNTPTKKTKVVLGATFTYETLGKLPLMHEGRIKPLDTVAREEIKGIYTRETINLTSADGLTVTSWAPVAAFFDWSVRPKFWDDQPIIPVEYLPLKRMILAGEIKEALEVVAGKAATSEADRSQIKRLVDSSEISTEDLRGLVRSGKLAEADAIAIEKLANKVGEGTKWLTPNDLETADVTVDDKKIALMTWFENLSNKKQGGPMSRGIKLSNLEEKALEVGVKLGRYRAIRDKESMGLVPLLITPRPFNQAMLNFAAASYRKAFETQGRGMSPLELESASLLNNYYRDIDVKDHAEPGANSKFDGKYTQWLKERSAWVPLGVIRDTPIEELTRAGFPTAKIEAFRAAFKAMEDEELTNPGRAGEKPALALLEAATDLGDSVNDSYYPSVPEMARESHYNRLSPFTWAQVAYGTGFLALMFSLIVTNFGREMSLEPFFDRVSQLIYLAGICAFTGGIGLEAYGFYLRVMITGWAPVTNMYETVIWVGMISAVIGFVLEAIYKQTWAAMAGSGIALVCTALAANVPLLDPEIKMLPPVLRNNFWLSIHVLTIVSSYAAFALAMGLGMVATLLYLTATYRRSASFHELAIPLLPGVPLLALGVVGYFASYGSLGSSDLIQTRAFWPSVVIGSIGLVLTATSSFAILGELLNRSTFHKLLAFKVLGIRSHLADDPFRAPLVAPPKEMSEDRLRTLAMQTTAARIKPISNFIYRSMQVGILLVAAGTFLGGWWADVSWGRFWGWDPKEVWALITLLVYLIPLHGRFAGWVNTFWLVMASVICFLSVLMAWYGVNFVLGVGLHSYGFTEGGSQGVVGGVTLIAVSYAFGAAWRRHLSQQVILATA